MIPAIRTDSRGKFVKTFHEDFFRQHGLAVDFREEYYTVSQRGVLRGLHFQLPPAAHAKLVYCAHGEVLDVVVDLRQGSPTYRKHYSVLLSTDKANQIYVPIGLAHGFFVVSETATVTYKVTSVYAPDLDSGILWNSAGITWPTGLPILSERDQSFSSLEKFVTPFRY